jgi:hypothetical protein
MVTPDEATDRSGPGTSGPGACQAPAPAGLDRLWRRWLAVVELYAQESRPRPPIGAPEYCALRRELIETCSGLASGAGDQQRGVYQRLEDLVAPWVSVSALEQADEAILCDLLRHCRQIDRQLVGRRRRFAVRPAVRLLAALLAFAAGAFLAVQMSGRALFSLLERANGWLLEARWAMTWAGLPVWLFLAGALVTLLACYLVSRVTRN